MTINLKFKRFFIVALSSGFSFFAMAGNEENNHLPPEATVAEATTPFWDLPHLEKSFIDVTPDDRNDGIPVGKLGIDGGNKETIVKLAQEISNGKHGSYDSLLIAHKGKLLFESYYLRGRVNLPHFQASATKSYTSLVLGRAIQLGYLTMADLHKPLVHFLKDLDPTKFVKGTEKITLHKALNMRSGIRISDQKRSELQENPDQLKGQGLIQTYLENSAPITAQSQSYLYSWDQDLVMQVIEAVVPGSAGNFIKNELFDKIGITNYHWKAGISGLPEAGAFASMTSRAMVKLGNLIINKGQLNGEQLISTDYITKATSGITQTTADWQPENYLYGYFWYQLDITVGDESYDTKLAWGGGGQHIIVIEELDLVIAITGHDGTDSIMTEISKVVLPAFAQNSVTMNVRNKNQDGFPAIESRYLGQKAPGMIPELFAPGIVSTEDHLETQVVFLPDMTEFSFARSGGEYGESTLFFMEYKGHSWRRKSVPLAEIDSYKERFHPSYKELNSLEPFKDIPIRGGMLSAKGTYYFYVLDPDGSGHMSYSRLINGKYEKPRKMSNAINRGKYIAHPFIAPDESYLMWDAEKEDENRPDVYISFRMKDGSWGTAINMGNKINTPVFEQRPRVTPDGKYLTFWRGYFKTREDGSRYILGDPYWVDAQIIEDLRPKQ